MCSAGAAGDWRFPAAADVAAAGAPPAGPAGQGLRRVPSGSLRWGSWGTEIAPGTHTAQVKVKSILKPSGLLQLFRCQYKSGRGLL